MPERGYRFIFGHYQFRRRIGNGSSWRRCDGSVAIAAHSQYTQVKEALAELDCDCPMHHHLKEMYGIETETTTKNTHTFVTDDPNDLMDILSKIFQGEFK